MKKRRLFLGFESNIFYTGLVSFFMDVSSEMIYPLVPLFLASVLGVNKSVIGLIEGLAESTASLLKVFSGWLSDRLRNRKNLMIAGYAISTLSRSITATAIGWPQMLAARFVDRLGKGIRTAPRDAIIAESCDSARLARSFNFHRSMDTMGAVVGPAIAMLVLGCFLNNYTLVFWLSIVPATIAVLIIIFCITKKSKLPAVAAAEPPKLTLAVLDWRGKYFFSLQPCLPWETQAMHSLSFERSNWALPRQSFPPFIYFLILSMPCRQSLREWWLTALEKRG